MQMCAAANFPFQLPDKNGPLRYLIAGFFPTHQKGIRKYKPRGSSQCAAAAFSMNTTNFFFWNLFPCPFQGLAPGRAAKIHFTLRWRHFFENFNHFWASCPDLCVKRNFSKMHRWTQGYHSWIGLDFLEVGNAPKSNEFTDFVQSSFLYPFLSLRNIFPASPGHATSRNAFVGSILSF